MRKISRFPLFEIHVVVSTLEYCFFFSSSQPLGWIKEPRMNRGSSLLPCRTREGHTPNLFLCNLYSYLAIYRGIRNLSYTHAQLHNHRQYNTYSAETDDINKSKFYQNHNEFPFAFDETMQFTRLRSS